MRADDIRRLFDYSYSANARILDAAERLDGDRFAGVPPVRGSADLRALLVHILEMERAWRDGLRSRGAHEPPSLDPAAFPDVPTLAKAWRDDEEQMRAWLANLDDADMDIPAAGGVPLWQCLTHVVNHGTQHRSEAAMLLTHWGQSPGELDLIYYPNDWGATPDVRLGPPPGSDERFR